MLTPAFASDRSDPDALWTDALTKAKRGQPQEAAEAFENYTTKYPEREAAWTNLGLQYHKLERYNDAEDAFKKGAALGSVSSKKGVWALYKHDRVEATPEEKFLALVDWKNWTLPTGLTRDNFKFLMQILGEVSGGASFSFSGGNQVHRKMDLDKVSVDADVIWIMNPEESSFTGGASVRSRMAVLGEKLLNFSPNGSQQVMLPGTGIQTKSASKH